LTLSSKVGSRASGCSGTARCAITGKPFDAQGMPNEMPANATPNNAAAMIAKRRLLMAKVPGEGHILPGAPLRPR
jgi:hypothetical protein